MNNATAWGGSTENGQVASVLTTNVSRLAVDSAISQGEDVDEEQGDVVDQHADTDTDETKDRDEEPEECILRAKQEVVLGKVERRLSRVGPPVEGVVRLGQGLRCSQGRS